MQKTCKTCFLYFSILRCFNLKVNLENAAGVDDPQLVYLYATWCVVLYYQKRYHAASSIATRLCSTINPTDAPPYGVQFSISPFLFLFRKVIVSFCLNIDL